MEKLIAALRVNGRNCQTGDLLFVSDPAPEFSWEYAAGAPVEWVQRAYRITAAVDSEKLADLSDDELSNLFYLYLDGKDEFWKKAAMEYVDEYCFENKF